MNTAHTRKSVVSAIAVGAVLLALNTPLVHAAPGDGPGSDNTTPPPGQVAAAPLEISVSENPVVFLPHQTTKTINFTWTPQPDSKVLVIVREAGVDLWSKVLDEGLTGPLDLEVKYGKFYWVWVCRVVHDTCPLAIITTERLEIKVPELDERQLPLPGQPGNNDRSTPQPTDRTGGQGPQRRAGAGSQESGGDAAEQQSRGQ